MYTTTKSMDVVYHLPFPEEVCSNIFNYACKSPHHGLLSKRLKIKLKHPGLNLSPFTEDLYDNDDEIIELDADAIVYFPVNISVHLSYYTCFRNLTFIKLNDTKVYGNIEELGVLPYLTDIYLRDISMIHGDIKHLGHMTNLSRVSFNGTGVSGNVKHLSTLLYLTHINLYDTYVSGDIGDLSTLLHLKVIYMRNTDITGDIADLISLRNLLTIDFRNTHVGGDIYHLSKLPKLQIIYLSGSQVEGNIMHLKSLQMLGDISFTNTRITGDITHLKYLYALKEMYLEWTAVTGDIIAFNEYRKNKWVLPCFISM